MSARVIYLLVRATGGPLAALDRLPPIHWVIVRAIRPVIGALFDASQARDLKATFELVIRDPRGRTPARFELQIAGGACNVRRSPARDPHAAVTAGADDLIRLAGARVGWPELLSGGTLELTGDPFVALRFPALFRLPASPELPSSWTGARLRAARTHQSQ